MMDDQVKAGLMARFAVFLDAAAAPAPDAGQPEVPDLYSLLAELLALKSEVKLEARQVKSALDQFRELFDTLRATNERLGEELARAPGREREARREAERELLLGLLDVRDRLQAGHDQARRYQPTWLARRGQAPAFVDSMAEGMGMSLRRIDELLARHGVIPIEVLGQPFDARIMQAAEVASEAGKPDGVVVAERRRGFRQDDRLLRVAEVVVNRAGGG